MSQNILEHHYLRNNLLLLITGRMYDEPYGYAISAWREAGLLKPSFVKPVLMTVESSVIEKKLGALSPEETATAKAQLFQLIFQAQ